MPQMSSLLWSTIIILTISLLLTISSFLYFMITPVPQTFHIHIHPSMSSLYFNWLW